MERPGKELGLLHHNGDGCQGFLPLRLPSSPPLPASWAFCLPHHREGMTPRNANCLHSAFKFQPSGCWGIQEIKIGPRAENCPRMAEPHGTCQHSMGAASSARESSTGSGHRHETGRSPHSQCGRDDGEDQTPTHSTRQCPASPFRTQPQHGSSHSQDGTQNRNQGEKL